MKNILAFVGHIVSGTTIQLCPCCSKAVIDNMESNGHSYFPIKLYLQKQAVGQIWPEDCSLPTTVWVQCSIQWGLAWALKSDTPSHSLVVWLNSLRKFPQSLNQQHFYITGYKLRYINSCFRTCWITCLQETVAIFIKWSLEENIRKTEKARKSVLKNGIKPQKHRKCCQWPNL